MALGALGALTACGSSASPVAGPLASARTHAVPVFAHIVVVVEENHSYDELIGSRQAPFLNQLTNAGAVLTRSYAITHPSEPNYLALFSGSTQGLADDSCPHQYKGANLAGALLSAGDSFRGYSEGLPSVGYAGCADGSYARKHNPWVDFPALPSEVNQPMTSFPSDFSALPTVSFVIPNLNHDMHDGSVAEADSWLQSHLDGFARWAPSHDSVLVVTADEDDRGAQNRVPTIVVGAHVRPGRYATRTDHYGVLRTILASEHLAPLNRAAHAAPVSEIWEQ